MIKILVGMAASLLLALQLTTSSFAQSDTPDPRTELLLQRLELLANPPSGPAAVVSRTFALRVRTTVTVASSLPLPHKAMCQVTLFHFNLVGGSFFEVKSQEYPMPATGNSFVCDITTNAKWLAADDTRPVSVNVTVRPLIKRIAILPDQEEYFRNRTASHSLTIPLPPAGTTTVNHALNL